MKAEIVLLIISAAIFISYVTTIALRFGIQKSISESYYDLPGEWRFVFTLTLWGFAIPVMIVGNSVLFFLAGGLICFVGAAAAFKEWAVTYKVHMIGAYGGVLLGFAGLLWDLHSWYLASIAIMIIIILWFTSQFKIWWIEITAFAAVWLGILIAVL